LANRPVYIILSSVAGGETASILLAIKTWFTISVRRYTVPPRTRTTVMLAYWMNDDIFIDQQSIFVRLGFGCRSCVGDCHRLCGGRPLNRRRRCGVVGRSVDGLHRCVIVDWFGYLDSCRPGGVHRCNCR